MDSLASVVPVAPTPVLVAFLAGLIFLYRAWPYLSIWKKQSLRTGRETKPVSAGADTAATSVEKQDEVSAVSKESEFPTDWWVGKETYELERRALFSKTWICLSHRSRFAKSGDYQSFQVAGFSIFLVRGKDGVTRAFHNVCRHRAYTVVEKECGSSPVLLCRYHGWSYNTLGNLIKAPHFDHVPGFQKAQNSLFEIHTVMSEDGFLFVNFDASPTVSAPETRDLDVFVRRHGLQTRSVWVAGQTVEGAFNWKLGLQSEDFLNTANLERELRKQGAIPLMVHLVRYFQRASEDHTVFPGTSFHTIQGTGCWYSLSFLPVSESKTAVRYDIYCDQVSSHSQTISKTIVRLLTEKVHELERQYRSYVSGGSDATIMKSLQSSETQKRILNHLQSHMRLEKLQGAEIYPTTRKPRDNLRFQQAEQLCKELDCQSDLKRKELSW